MSSLPKWKGDFSEYLALVDEAVIGRKGKLPFFSQDLVRALQFQGDGEELR